MKKFTIITAILITANLLSAQIINIPDDYPTIQQGIDAANQGDTVLVQPGTYVENILLPAKDLTLASLFLLTQDTSYISQTIIDGDHQESVIRFDWSFTDIDILINGFTIQNGGDGYYETGGGISVGNDPPTFPRNLCFEHMIISDNAGMGGILIKRWVEDSLTKIIIRHVKLVNNACRGIYCENLNPTIQNVECKGNRCVGNGGGFSFLNSNPIIQNVFLLDNWVSGISSSAWGGGAYFENSNPVLNNVVVAGNSSDAMHFRNSSPTLVNVTVTDNESSGIFVGWNSQLILSNSVIWENDCPPNKYQIVLAGTSSCTISHSDIGGGENGISINENSILNWLDENIQDDPLFLESSDPPFQLSEDSPCIDAGTPDTTGLYLPEWDLLGNVRIWDGDMDGDTIVDMGAYEFAAISVGIRKPKAQNSEFAVRSYPNPFSNECTIEFNMDRTTFCSIQIFNNTGEKVYDLGNKIFPKGKNHVNWSANNLSKGIYLCRIQIGNKMVTKKIIKIE